MFVVMWALTLWGEEAQPLGVFETEQAAREAIADAKPQPPDDPGIYSVVDVPLGQLKEIDYG